MATTTKQYKVQRSQFRRWLQAQISLIQSEITSIEGEMATPSLVIYLVATPLTIKEVRDFDVASLTPDQTVAFARLGLLQSAHSRLTTRFWQIVGALDGNALNLKAVYQEFIEADEDHDMAHAAMLLEVVEGLKEELWVTE